jgi:TPP-dependent pyruvate/acetoin dehydrogenase alpha subunit
VLFLCENNLYAMGTRIDRALARPDLPARAHTYGVVAESVDGMDVLAVEKAARIAATHVRTTGTPYFLEARTYRFRAHSMFDAELYRDKTEVDEWKQRDPIAALRRHLGIADADLASVDGAVINEIAGAVAFAEAGSWEATEQLTRDVYTPHEENSRERRAS